MISKCHGNILWLVLDLDVHTFFLRLAVEGRLLNDQQNEKSHLLKCFIPNLATKWIYLSTVIDSPETFLINAQPVSPNLTSTAMLSFFNFGSPTTSTVMQGLVSDLGTLICSHPCCSCSLYWNIAGGLIVMKVDFHITVAEAQSNSVPAQQPPEAPKWTLQLLGSIITITIVVTNIQ